MTDQSIPTPPPFPFASVREYLMLGVALAAYEDRLGEAALRGGSTSHADDREIMRAMLDRLTCGDSHLQLTMSGIAEEALDLASIPHNPSNL